jgi:iron(III) transport system permease protein
VTTTGRARAARTPGRIGLGALALVATLPFLAPAAYLLVRNLEEPGLLGRLSDPEVLGPLGRSLLLGTSVAASAALLGTGLAWLIARTDLPARRLLLVALALPLVFPSFVFTFAMIAALAPGGLMQEWLGLPGVPVRGFWAAYAVLTLVSFPYVLLPAAARLRSLPPSLEESSRVLGRGPLETFGRIVLPQTAPAIAAGSLLVFLYVVGDFGVVQLTRYETLTQAIYANRLFDRPASLAMALVLGVVAITALAGERWAGRRMAHRAGPLGHPRPASLGAWRWPALGGVLAVVAASLLLPIGVLAYWATRGLSSGARTAGDVRADAADLTDPLLATAGVSVAAAVATVLVILPIAYWSGRVRGRGAGTANALVGGGFALPGLVIALSLVLYTLSAPEPIAGLYQTMPLLLLAYLVSFGALALGPARVAVGSVPERLDEAARVLGAPWWRRMLTVELPIIAPGLLAGGGLVLLSTAKELPATLLLAPPGFQTLATRIWGATEEAYWATASLDALALVAISGLLTWVLVIRRADALR